MEKFQIFERYRLLKLAQQIPLQLDLQYYVYETTSDKVTSECPSTECKELYRAHFSNW